MHFDFVMQDYNMFDGFCALSTYGFVDLPFYI